MTEQYTLNLEEMFNTLWNMGMDEDPRRAGYLDDELEVRDGQQCEVLEWHGDGLECVALVRWQDGEEEEIPAFGLIELK